MEVPNEMLVDRSEEYRRLLIAEAQQLGRPTEVIQQYERDTHSMLCLFALRHEIERLLDRAVQRSQRRASLTS